MKYRDAKVTEETFPREWNGKNSLRVFDMILLQTTDVVCLFILRLKCRYGQPFLSTIVNNTDGVETMHAHLFWFAPSLNFLTDGYKSGTIVIFIRKYFWINTKQQTLPTLRRIEEKKTEDNKNIAMYQHFILVLFCWHSSILTTVSKKSTGNFNSQYSTCFNTLLTIW